MTTYRLRLKPWRYPGDVAWYFVTLPKKESAAIKKAFGPRARGWGSLPVRVTVGKTSWRTSIFPDAKSGTYLLPLKAAVRAKEGVTVLTTPSFAIEILA
jgi:hypothetical protein